MKTECHVILSILSLSLCFAFGCGPRSTGAPASHEAKPALEQPAKEAKKASIGKFMESKGELSIDERIALYHQVKRESPTAYNFEEEKELNQYGYLVLFSKTPPGSDPGLPIDGVRKILTNSGPMFLHGRLNARHSFQKKSWRKTSSYISMGF